MANVAKTQRQEETLRLNSIKPRPIIPNAVVAAKEDRVPSVKTIGLCMIVKNESKVILRCLESVRPLVDYVLIEDTGSTDGTQSIVREWLGRVGLPGEVYDEPWRNFAYNRSHVLARLRENSRVDYAFIIDADDALVLDEGFDVRAFKKRLSKDSYNVQLRHGALLYSRPLICSNHRVFLFRGVLHEFLESPPGSSAGEAAGFHVLYCSGGARSQDPDKFRKDAQVLEKALQSEEDPFLRSRYTYYLAQSYRDGGEKEKALSYFLKRAELGYWVDEVFVSLLYAARVQRDLGRPYDEALATYLRASEAAPRRAEALHGASHLSREHKKFGEGYEYARRGLAIPLPTDGLFVEKWIYEYGLLDELAVNAYWVARYQECFDACQRLLDEKKMPLEMHDRVRKNANFALEKIGLQRAPAPQVPRSAAQSGDSRHRRTFVMISTKRSLFYTRHCIASFFQRTEFSPLDRFIFIANDHDASEFRTDSRLDVIENSTPKSFAINVNMALQAARASGSDLVLLNNDMVFVDNWLSPLLHFPNAITLPMCNQTHKYRRDDLDLSYSMDWEQFGGRFDALQEIARSHREQFAEGASQTRLLMPFYCFHLPNKVLTDVGDFDETFDCGGEDVDYRLRTLLAGYDVVYAAQSYVLHFMGKSTWRGGESKGETLERDKKYFARFSEKWGDDAATIFLASKQSKQRVSDLGLTNLVDSGQFRQLVERCISGRPNLFHGAGPQRMPPPQVAEALAKTRSTWAPETPLAGTELMVDDLRKRLGTELDRINLQVNHPGHDTGDTRPRVVWMHHDINQTWVQWCKDRELVDSVDCFIFVSHWQREQYLNTFGLPPERCFVLRHALDPSAGLRRWEGGATRRCAYTSTPFRGLSVLLDAWERLSPANAELHIWSSMKLYLLDDGPYEHLYQRAESMPGVIYHGIAPNHELRAALRSMHFLVYPCTFRETACLSVIEAMAAGCRVIVPSFGALPETTGGYARIYPSNPDPAAHAEAFADVMASEFRSPWAGDPAMAFAQQNHCAAVYDWPRRLGEWRQLIETTARMGAVRTPAIAYGK